MNTRKSLLFLLLLVIQLSVFGQQYWLHQPCPTTRFLTRIVFVDTINGWAAGDSGTVIHTTNSGANWVIQQTGLIISVEDMVFLDPSNGWFIANDYGPVGTTFRRTTNGGSNWIPASNPDTTAYFLSIFFLNANTGFTAGLGGTIYKTTNTGTNWTRCGVDSSFFYAFPIRRIKFLDSLTGFACGGQYDYGGVVWMTTNGGLNWNARGVSPEPNFDIRPFSATKIMLSGGDFEFGAAITTSFDLGNSWNYQSTGCYGIGRSIAVRTPNEIWVPLSFAQMWAVNLDSGAANGWFCVHAPDTTSVYDALFKSPTFGWAVGCIGYECKGTLLKYNTSIIGVSPVAGEVPVKLQLYQNYPNPFNPTTEIKFYMPSSGLANLSVYDITGRIVVTLVNSKLDAGFHKVLFDGKNLSSGVYIFRITYGSSSEFRKMVLLK